MKRSRIVLALALSTYGLACTGGDGTGGVTARLIFQDAEGKKRQSLRLAAVPMEVSRLRIYASMPDGTPMMDANGNPLETVLFGMPASASDEQLVYEGGSWELAGIPPGTVSIVAETYDVNDTLTMRGQIDGIEVRANETSDAGELVLVNVIDEAPGAPPTVVAGPLPEGEALEVTFTAPADNDVIGYVIAVATGSVATAPPITAGRALSVGDDISGGLEVRQILASPTPQPQQIRGLIDQTAYTVIVYAFDGPNAISPALYSPGTIAMGTPVDTAPPAAAILNAVFVGADQVELSFTGVPEDDPIAAPGSPAGRVASYDLRSALTEADLTGDFVGQTVVTPAPAPLGPGQSITSTLTFVQLGVDGTQPFAIGLRAVDAAGNLGPVATIALAATGTPTPVISSLTGVLTTGPTELQGTNFGVQTGTVSLMSGTVTTTLAVTTWSDTSVLVTVPDDAGSGSLTLSRADGPSTTETVVVLFANSVAFVEDLEAPFEFVGTEIGGTGSFALYRERTGFGDSQATVEKVFERDVLITPPTVDVEKASAVGGDYSLANDRFLFLASDSTQMRAWLVASSSVAPDPLPIENAVAAGGADSVSPLLLPPVNIGEYPAMVSFTQGGSIHTASVADVLTVPIATLNAIVDANEDYSNVKLLRGQGTEIWMTHLTTSATVANAPSFLTLRRSPAGVTNAFAVEPMVNPPQVVGKYQALNLPLITPDIMIAYEYATPGGTQEIRLTTLNTRATWPDGFDPRPNAIGDERLEDVGLIDRGGGELWVILLVSVTNGTTAQLFYLEFPLTTVTENQPSPDFPGASIDGGGDGARARLACKPAALSTCPIVWLGSAETALFIRQ